jgi:hypothetical protein
MPVVEEESDGEDAVGKKKSKPKGMYGCSGIDPSSGRNN